MKIILQYLYDTNGRTQTFQLHFGEWVKLRNELKKYEQALKLKSDLKDALAQVAVLRKTKGHKKILNEFLNELY